MPQSVPLADAQTRVLPYHLCKAFRPSRVYPSELNELQTGVSIRGADATNSRRTWEMTEAMSHADLVTLRGLYDSWGAQPFHYYEQIAPFTFDATGADDTNRYTVRFEGRWTQNALIGYCEAPITLVEVAGVLPGSGSLTFNNANSSGHLGG